MRDLSLTDEALRALDHALRVLGGVNMGTGRPMPAPVPVPEGRPAQPMTTQERRHAAGLMRVNHAGEIAAQGLYEGQALFAQTPKERQFLKHAGQEEADHLRWTRERVKALGARTSLLDPAWYLGAFVLGAVAARMGSKVSMGFLAETEVQVEAHLKDHLGSLPACDEASLAVIRQMMADEHEHAQAAGRRGAAPLPSPIPQLMKASARLMTSTAYWV